MNRFWSITIGAIIVTSLIVLGFTILQIQDQKDSLIYDLQYRTQILSGSFVESIEPAYNAKSYDNLQKLIDKFTDKQGLLGLVVFNNKGDLVASSGNVLADIFESSLPKQVMDLDRPLDVFVTINNKKIYQFTE